MKTSTLCFILAFYFLASCIDCALMAEHMSRFRWNSMWLFHARTGMYGASFGLFLVLAIGAKRRKQ